jgi:hypothetical protein
MSKQWTTREQKDCAAAYSTQGLDAAISITGRGSASIINKMYTLGCKSPKNRPPDTRKHYAENIAEMMEMESSGLKHSIIGEYFNLKRKRVGVILSEARQQGFDAYPLRNK